MNEHDIERLQAFYNGMRDGIRMYAHWKDGVQYVGTTGRTLNEALTAVDKEEKEIMEKYFGKSISG